MGLPYSLRDAGVGLRVNAGRAIDVTAGNAISSAHPSTRHGFARRLTRTTPPHSAKRTE